MTWEDNPAFKRGDLTAAKAAPREGFIKRKRVLEGIRDVLLGAGVHSVRVEKFDVIVPGWSTVTASSPSKSIQRVGLRPLVAEAVRKGHNKPYAVFGVPAGARTADEAYVVIPIEYFARLVAATQVRKDELE